ncbi:MAG: hypothetical protein Q9168_000561 [Polycauliona sp. 1 TL-2023]
MPQSTFFNRYPQFRQVHTNRIDVEFQRLALRQGWVKRTTEWKVRRGDCLQAEYELQLGHIQPNGDRRDWQALCQELGVSIHGDPSITQCKKALKRVHVNLLDLIDARRTSEVAQRFPSAGTLAQYTRDRKRYFPLGKAKEDSLKKILLREIN